jgi:hypothetical protein
MNTHILLGIKNEHAHGSSHDAEGFGGFSIDTNSITIINQGTMGELMSYVETQRKMAEMGKEEMDYLDRHLEYGDMDEEEYGRKYDEISRKMYISRFDKLMIVNGIVL